MERRSRRLRALRTRPFLPPSSESVPTLARPNSRRMGSLGHVRLPPYSPPPLILLSIRRETSQLYRRRFLIYESVRSECRPVRINQRRPSGVTLQVLPLGSEHCEQMVVRVKDSADGSPTGQHPYVDQSTQRGHLPDRGGHARRSGQEMAGIPTIARNSSVVFVTGNGSLGTSRPSRSQMGSHPSVGDHSSRRSLAMPCRTASLCRS
jgi:hypothetical protein